MSAPTEGPSGDGQAAMDWVHSPPPGPTWLESFWFGFYDPVTQTGLVTLLGFNAREPRSRLWLLLVEGGSVSVDATDLTLPLATPDGFAVDVGGVRMEMLADDRSAAAEASYRLCYETGQASFDLVWQGIAPLKLTTGGRPFPGQLDLDPRGHSEQPCTVSGAMSVSGRSHVVRSAPAWRDHLWGHAVSDGWSEMGRWAWITGSTSSGRLSFNVSSHRFPDGREGLYGFVFEEGVPRRISVTRCDLETTADGLHPRSCSVHWVEQEGGSTCELTGEVIAPLHVEEPTPGGRCIINDPPARFDLGGEIAYGTIELGMTLAASE